MQEDEDNICESINQMPTISINTETIEEKILSKGKKLKKTRRSSMNT